MGNLENICCHRETLKKDNDDIVKEENKIDEIVINGKSAIQFNDNDIINKNGIILIILEENTKKTPRRRTIDQEEEQIDKVLGKDKGKKYEILETENRLSEESLEKLLSEYTEKFTSENLKRAINTYPLFQLDGYNEYNIPKEIIDKFDYIPNLKKEIILLDESSTSFYSGTVNTDGQKHGFGILMNSKGEKFEGFWENECFQPYGRYISPKGELCEGSYENGKLNGIGKVVKSDKEFIGEFVNGIRNGTGKEKSKLEEYEGSFKNDKKDGHGKLLFLKSNNTYIGEFKEGKMTGQCEFIWANNDRYIGSIINGVFEGQGKYYWNDGMTYEGNYDNGIRRGYGIFQWKDGKIYKGEFENNLPHGNGVIIHNGIERNVRSHYGASISGTQESNRDEKMSMSMNTPY